MNSKVATISNMIPDDSEDCFMSQVSDGSGNLSIKSRLFKTLDVNKL